MFSLKTFASAAMIASALGFASFGLAGGVANAAPALPGIPWQQDHGHGHGHGGWGGDDNWGPGPGWGPGAGYWGAPAAGYWGGPYACISATGPFGYVTATGCL